MIITFQMPYRYLIAALASLEPKNKSVFNQYDSIELCADTVNQKVTIVSTNKYDMFVTSIDYDNSPNPPSERYINISISIQNYCEKFLPVGINGKAGKISSRKYWKLSDAHKNLMLNVQVHVDGNFIIIDDGSSGCRNGSYDCGIVKDNKPYASFDWGSMIRSVLKYGPTMGNMKYSESNNSIFVLGKELFTTNVSKLLTVFDAEKIMVLSRGIDSHSIIMIEDEVETGKTNCVYILCACMYGCGDSVDNAISNLEKISA